MSAAWFDALTGVPGLIVVAFDADLRVAHWGPGAVDLFEILAEDVVGERHFACLAHGIPEQTVVDTLTAVLAGNTLTDVEQKIGERTVRWNLRAATHQGRPAVIAVGVDLTAERRRAQAEAEAQIVASSRLAAVGTLAAGVAHEINNPLAAVIANVSYLVRRRADDAELREVLGDVLDAAQRMRRIVRDLGLFARPVHDAEPGPVAPAVAVTKAVALARNEIHHRARLVTLLDDLPPVLALESKLVQVFVNLLVNAAHAIPEGRSDRYTITVRGRVDGDAVEIDVADTGVGMTDEVADRVFEPFFTTKPVGQGSGLGLSICHGLVAGMGGSINLVSTPGEGTVVTMRLPRAAVPEEPAARVLIIDDDRAVARAIARCFVGHDVEVLTEGAEAVQRLTTSDELFDLVLCDLMMPSMAGWDIHAAVRAVRPEQADRFAFVTGGAFTPSAQQFLDSTPLPVLEKPLDSSALRALVEDT